MFGIPRDIMGRVVILVILAGAAGYGVVEVKNWVKDVNAFRNAAANEIVTTKKNIQEIVNAINTGRGLVVPSPPITENTEENTEE